MSNYYLDFVGLNTFIYEVSGIDKETADSKEILNGIGDAGASLISDAYAPYNYGLNQ